MSGMSWHGGCLEVFTMQPQAYFVKKIDMETYSPELSKLLLGAQSARYAQANADEVENTHAQEVALEELAERISAARSIV